jgi:hypothetical protein
MSEPMTLEHVRDRCIAWIGDVTVNGSLSGAAANDIREMFAHLSQPAQAADVEYEVAGYFIEFEGDFSQAAEQYKGDPDVFPLYRALALKDSR